MKNNNYLIFLFFIVLELSIPKISAQNKYIKNKYLDNRYNHSLNSLKKNVTVLDYHAMNNDYILAKIDTWIDIYKAKIKKEKRKIVIKKDYLNLVKTFPSKNNISSDIFDMQIKESEILTQTYIKNIKNLKEDYKYFNSKGYFYIYLIKYNYKNFKLEKNKLENFNWMAMCLNTKKHKKELNLFRQKLLDNVLPRQKKEIISQINLQSIKTTKSKIDNKICNDFTKLTGPRSK